MPGIAPFYQQQNELYDKEYSYHNIVLPQDSKPQRRLSFSALLQKRPTLMGRKLSIFSRQKKPQLKLVIPQLMPAAATTLYEETLDRVDTMASQLTESTLGTTEEEDEDDGPTTPTTSVSPYQQQPSPMELKAAVTTIKEDDSPPLMDYSGKGYSNFYMKLPNGNWMIRVRDGNRRTVGTYEINGSMI